jgi:hypothetical protein
MSASAFEAFLVNLYVDPNARVRFKSNPQAELDQADLTVDERNALISIDWVNFEMAAHSFARKRETKRRQTKTPFLTRIFRAWSRR